MRLIKQMKKNRGFTLIEILVVVGILGVLSSFVLMNILEERKGSRDSQRKSDITRIQSVLESYYSDNGSYPVSAPGGTFLNNQPCGQTFQGGGSTYLSTIPCDPLGMASSFNNGSYYYYSADGSTYTLAACLERKTDSQGQGSLP